MTKRGWAILFLLAAAGAGALAGCGSGTTGTAVPNAAPDTRVTGIPPVLEQTEFTVGFFWTGSDLDGKVDHFEWRISNNGRDGKIDAADTLGVAWHKTSATDSTFVVAADIDSFDVDVDNLPPDRPGDYRAWQTHTFFIRAVDDDGLADPTPASVSFTATTLTPTIEIDVPPRTSENACTQSARVLTFGWTGRDPDDITQQPAFVRFGLFPATECWNQERFRTLHPLDLIPDSQWGPWIPYDAPQDSGRTVTLPRQALQKWFFFAVQAKDKAGAVTPTFDWGINVRHVEISDTKKPVLEVTERFLGSFQFSSAAGLQIFEIVAGQPLEFDWRADASQYAGVIDAFRYGWEVQDVNDPNDPGWAVGWGNGPLFRRAGPKSFSQGTPNFVVQTRDNSGTVVRGIFQFDVIQIAQRQNQRDLLLVQDWPHNDTAPEITRHRDWNTRWDNLLLGRVTNFDSGQDILDTHTDPEGFTFRRVNEYKSVIYFSNGGSRGTRFHAQLAPLSTLLPRYNWFEVYQSRVGNVLMCGPQSLFNSIEYDAQDNPPNWVYPIIFNVPDGPSKLGFGRQTAQDGTQFNRGTIRYPYTAFCLELIDFVRPAPTQVFDEPTGLNNQIRTLNCDGLYKARVDPTFLARYPSANGEVVDLLPSSERQGANFNARAGDYQFAREEYYNFNATNREVTLITRDCQQVMYRWRARRDEGQVAAVDTICFPHFIPSSKIDGAPVGIISTVYSQTKPLNGSEDIVWGFHPLAFDLATVRSAMLWIFRERWQLAVQ